MIAVERLSVCYAHHDVNGGESGEANPSPAWALREVDLQVEAGECLLITGASGCGKSTLARAIAGLIPHAIPARVEGQVSVAGMRVADHTIPELATQIGFVFQNPASQLFHLRVEDEVAFGPRNLGWPEAEISRSVDWALETVGLAGLRERRPGELSGGQKQRVAIAAALAMRPQVLILDEPAASLDIQGTQSVVAALQKLHRQQGMTILLIEHRLGEVAHLADRVVVMDAGSILACGSPEQIFQDRDLLRGLGLRRPVDERQASWEKLIQPNGRPPEGARPILELQNITAGYPKHTVLQDVSLALYPGDFAALVGENGAGKSTLALVAAGLLKPVRGKVIFQGGRRPQPGLDVSLLFQNPADQFLNDCVEEEVAYGPRNYGLFDPGFHQQILEHADLGALRDRKPWTLSAGQQQRAALAACMALRPRVLILDEPTLGQDWDHLQRLMDLLAAFNRQGTTILLITHDYKIVHRYARRVIRLDAGRPVLDGKLAGGADSTLSGSSEKRSTIQI
jgi:energy-coupling factor transport system ATP-binding protein